MKKAEGGVKGEGGVGVEEEEVRERREEVEKKKRVREGRRGVSGGREEREREGRKEEDVSFFSSTADHPSVSIHPHCWNRSAPPCRFVRNKTFCIVDGPKMVLSPNTRFMSASRS